MCLSCLIAEVIDEDYHYIYENMKYLKNELSRINKQDTKGELDVLVEVGNKIIDVEAYTSYDQVKRNKNINYISKLWFMNYNYKNKYKNNKEILQINYIQGKYDNIHYLQDKEKCSENLKMYEISVDEDEKIKYTKSKYKNFILWCKFLKAEANSPDKLCEIIEEMEYDEETKKQLKKEVRRQMEITLDDVMTTTWESIRELDIASAEFTGEQRGRAEGEKLGRAEGEKVGEKNTIFKHIIKMLKKNICYSDISDITGVSVDEIESYSHELDLSEQI